MTEPSITRLSWRPYALLVIAALALFLPGRGALPPLDRDESRYMQATSQMLETGDYIDVRFQDQPRYLQPAGIYWLEAAAVSVFSAPGERAVWAYRIPSLIAATAAVLLTAWIGAALFGGQTGLAAALLLGCSLLLGVEARMAKIDATLLAAILTAQAALLRIYLRRDGPERPGPGVAAVYWLALGAGLMLKGPLILLVCWGTLAALVAVERRARWLGLLRPAWGVPLMLAVVLPWCIAIWLKSGGSFFASAIGNNFLGKVAQGQQAHGLPPGYYLGVFPLSFWPGSLFAVLAIPFVWARRRTAEVRFLLAWIGPTWLAFEAVTTKLPHYVLPTYPAIACLAAAAVFAPPGARALWENGRAWRWARRVFLGVWLVLGVGLAVAGPVLLAVVERRVLVAPVLGGLLVLPLVAAVPLLLARARSAAALGAACGAALMAFASAYLFVVPELRTIWLSPRIAAEVARVKPCPGSVVAASGFSEPSLVFLLGKETRLIGAADAAAHLAQDRACALALVGTRQAPEFLAAAAAANVTPRALGSVSGINYSNGRRLDLTIYAASE